MHLPKLWKASKRKLRGANQQIADLQDTITELRKKLSAAEGDIFVLRQTVEQRDAVIAEKNAEIAERVKMAEVLSRDRSKQADESLQRLASRSGSNIGILWMHWMCLLAAIWVRT